MTVKLEKGGNVSLEKEAPGITNFILGLGWDENVEEGADFDLDASLLMVDEKGKVLHTEQINQKNWTLKSTNTGFSVIYPRML